MEARIKNVEDIDVFYDRDRDVLYISFGEVREADDSELTSNDVVVRYRKGEVVGVTVLEFSKRGGSRVQKDGKCGVREVTKHAQAPRGKAPSLHNVRAEDLREGARG